MEHDQQEQANFIEKHPYLYWLLPAGVLLLSWIPCFLAFYPCIYSYDVLDQMAQIIMGTYSAKHPLIHTLLIKVCYEAGFYLLHSATMGMALYALLQMVVLSLSFGYGWATLWELGVNKALWILTFLWFLLFPVHAMLAVSVTKDILFTAFFVLQFSMTLRLLGLEKWRESTRHRLELGIMLTAMLLFRNNAMPALLLADLVLALVWMIRRYREKKAEKNGRGSAKPKEDLLSKEKQLLVVWTGSLLAAFLLLTCLRITLHADPGDPKEALSVPLQQIACVVTRHEEEIDPDLLQELYTVFDREAIFHYEPWLVDQIKGGFSSEVYVEKKETFWKLWGKLFIAYPGDYVKAFLDNSAGAWNPMDTTHAQVYGYRPQDGLGYLRSDFSHSEYTGYLGGEVRQNSHLPGVKAWYEDLLVANHYQDWPNLRYLFSPAVYNILLLLEMICFALWKEKRWILVGMLPIVAYCISVFFGPGILVRYLYPVMCCAVLGICLLLPFVKTMRSH